MRDICDTALIAALIKGRNQMALEHVCTAEGQDAQLLNSIVLEINVRYHGTGEASC